MTKNNAREQIIAKLKEAQNVLITVSNNPSVDELAAALALTLAINKADKHATAVASGEMPDALEFLNPNKTFETSVDSLRDFIIALNKEKADHLRYKLVGDHVKIFITPYRSIITEKDLEFEQGDFNVDMVLALGVSNKDHLDGALAAHGRIFHDASVGVLTLGEKVSDLSDLNWHDEQASSLSEMALELIESDSIGKKSLNKSVATAILTGIIAETERFSNQKANAKVMNLASKLIMAGADQQLVISKLREAEKKQVELNLRKEIENQSESLKEAENEIQKIEELPKPKKDASVLTIERKETSIEDENDNSLESVSINLSDKEAPVEKTPEFVEAEKLAVDFPAVQTVEQANPELAFEELPSTDNRLSFEESPIEQISQLPEQQNPPIQPELNNNSIVEEINPAQVISPVENFAPEIPQPELSQQNVFISEQPIESVEFTPAEKTDFSNQAIQNTILEPIDSGSEIPQPELNQDASTQPYFGAREYIGDDYYNPDLAQELAQNLAKTSIHDTNANETHFVQPDVSSHGVDLTPPTLGMTAEVNSPAAENPAQNFGGFPPPVPDFSSMPLPPELPPIPDFNGVDFNAMPAPTQPISEQDFSFNQEQNQPDIAQGTSASTNNIIADQVYPQDPAQFKIPGM